MKLAVLACILGLVVSGALGLGYHEDVGIPTADRMRQAEAQAGLSRIIGGVISKWADNPYLVGVLVTLVNGKLSVCGGTILSENKILTAGQCWFDGYTHSRKIQVVLDALRLFSAQRRNTNGVVIHPGFNPFTPTNDLAILTLVYNIYFYRDVAPVSLPTNDMVANSFYNMTATASGFGKSDDWSPINPEQNQRHIDVPVIDFGTCYSALGPAITSETICTSAVFGMGPCDGDLGGPLVIRNLINGTDDVLIGVTSIQSRLDCQNGFPTGYMRVTSYLGWIQSNM